MDKQSDENIGCGSKKCHVAISQSADVVDGAEGADKRACEQKTR